MRRLLYVPILHDEADPGSVGTALARKSAALSGERRWALHKESVHKFWESVASYLGSFDPGRLTVYQDGLAAGGDIGRRIVEEATRRGSKNYQLVLQLLDGGAEIRKTEDPVLLLSEYERVHGEARQDTGEESLLQARGDHLLEERDSFIANRVSATLREGELGVLFIGAHHNVVSRLAADIWVETV